MTPKIEALKNYLKKRYDLDSSDEDRKEIDRLKMLLMEQSTNMQDKCILMHIFWRLSLETSCENLTKNFPITINDSCCQQQQQLPFIVYLNQCAQFEFLKIFRLPIEFDDLKIIDGFINASYQQNAQHFFLRNFDVYLEIFDHLLNLFLTFETRDKFWNAKVLVNFLEKIRRTMENNEQFKLKITQISQDKRQCLVKKCFKIVHSFWDSKYTGVAELIVDFFRHFFHIFCQNQPGFEIDVSISNYLTNFPIFTRGKYRIVAVLIEFANPDEFLRVEWSLYSSLTRPLKSNNVAPFVGTIFKAVLFFISKNLKNLDEDIAPRWLALIPHHLLFNNEQVIYNTRKHFLPPALKYLAEFFEDTVVNKLRYDFFKMRKLFNRDEWKSGVRLSIDPDQLSSIDSRGRSIFDIKNFKFDERLDDDNPVDNYLNTLGYHSDLIDISTIDKLNYEIERTLDDDVATFERCQYALVVVFKHVSKDKNFLFGK